MFFPEPVWCFLKNIKRKGGQLTENISRATQKDLCKPLENETESCVRKDLKKDLKKELKKELKEYRSQGIPLYEWKTKFSQVHCESLSDRRGRWLYAGLRRG